MFISEKKYKLTDETIKHKGRVLRRIEALKDFAGVKMGDKGGFIKSENNLSHEGNCWVFNDAKVCGDAIVCGDSIVCDDAIVYSNAIVCGNARIYNNAKIGGNAKVCGNAKVSNNAEIFGNAFVYGNADIYDNALVYGYALVYDNAQIYGNAEICGHAIIANNFDYIVFESWWDCSRFFTWTKSNNMWYVGWFYGTGKELIEKAYNNSELSGREYERVVKYVESTIKAE